MLESFDTLIQLSQNKSDGAAVRLAKLSSHLADAERKGKVLARYRDEYRAGLDAAGLRGAPAAELANFRAFLAKLDEAVGQQANETVFWGEQIARARAEWQEEQRKLQSFTTIAGRRRSEHVRTLARREQKSQDEFAARMTKPGGFSAFGE
jgi:flagellar FliJ protein